jgi:MFS family permease
MVGIAQFAGFILVPQYVQEPAATGYGFGASPLASGVFLLPMTIGILVIGLVAGRLERRHGARPLLVGGAIVTAGAFVLLTFFRGEPLEVYTASALHGVGIGIAIAALANGYATMLIGRIVLGLGVGGVSAAMPQAILAATPTTETASAMGLNQVVRVVGFSSGSALGGLMLAAATGSLQRRRADAA